MTRKPTLSFAMALFAVAIPAAAQTVDQFLDSRNYPIPLLRGANLVRTADFDRDGDLDCLAADTSSTAQPVMLNDGRGVFTFGSTPTFHTTPDDIVLGDFDRDGDIDAIYCAASSPSAPAIRMLRNDGRANFTQISSGFPAISSAYRLAALDFDRDGDLDLAYIADRSTRSATNLRLLRNDGSGGFTPFATTLPNLLYGRELVAVDVDKDRDPDLIVAQNDSTFASAGKPWILVNDGSGVFSDGSSGMPAFAVWATGFEVADFDGDGSSDVFITAQGNAGAQRDRILLGNGQGGFLDATTTLLATRFDLSVDAEVFDVEGDGDLDLFVTGFSPGNKLLINRGRRSGFDVAPATRVPNAMTTGAVVAGDFDRDGDADVMIGTSRSNPSLRMLINDGLGRFRFEPLGSLPHVQSDDVAFFDADGDGDLDAFLARSNQDQLLLNSGGTRLGVAPAGRVPTDTDWSSVVKAGDVDGDNDIDLLIGKNFNRGLRLLLGDGSGRFQASTKLPTLSLYVTDIALEDFDGDGDLDAYVANFASGSSSGLDRLLLNNGQGTFTDASFGRIPALPVSSTDVASADLDGDNDQDLIVAGTRMSGGQSVAALVYLQNDGMGRFTDVSTARLPALGTANPRNIVFSDVDGDNDLDMVLACGRFPNPAGARPRLYLNDGMGRFSDATTARFPGTGWDFSEAAAADWDLDGDVDLVLNGTQQPEALYLNNGSGNFTNATSTRLPNPRRIAWSRGLTVVDVDGDGDSDLYRNDVFGDALLLNAHRQVDVRRAPRVGRLSAFDFHAEPGYAGGAIPIQPFLALGLTPMPVSFPPYGRFALDPGTLIVLPAVVAPANGGFVSATLPIPALSALSGIDLFAQALVQHGPSQSEWRLTGAITATIR